MQPFWLRMSKLFMQGTKRNFKETLIFCLCLRNYSEKQSNIKSGVKKYRFWIKNSRSGNKKFIKR